MGGGLLDGGAGGFVAGGTGGEFPPGGAFVGVGVLGGPMMVGPPPLKSPHFVPGGVLDCAGMLLPTEPLPPLVSGLW